MVNLYNKIEQLCKENETNITFVCKNAGISRAALSELKMGRSKTLSNETMSKIADYFDVSVDYLLGKSDKKRPSLDEQLSDIDFALYGEVRELTEEDKQEVLEFIKFKKSLQNNKGK